ncbi:uncharacterized protein CG4449 [Venturia canescens]|uniref:uncharacterized protein CG4449 n=1 Tax=Venturia canescens TaxID=32260 RepID=UPI001C9BC711|nr:uncharacterized protein CG4449 [Venturia canescens]
MDLTSDTSSDDDDIYVSAAARLKALKKKNPLIPQPDSPKVETVRTEENLGVTDSRNQVDNTVVTIISPSSIRNYVVHDVPDQCGGRRTRNSRRSVRSGVSSRTATLASTQISQRRNPIVIQDDLPVFDISEDSFEHRDHDVSKGDEDYVVDVKIKWMSKGIVRLELRKHETFEKVFKHFADEEGVSEKQILLTLGNREILKKDTPASIDLKVIDFLEGGLVSANVANERNSNDNCKVKLCRVKVQMAASKQKIEVDLKMDEAFEKVVSSVAEKLNVEPSRIKLEFDGDTISPSDTPESLDLEDQVCVDLYISST